MTGARNKDVTKTVASLQGSRIESGDDDAWVNRTIKVPPLPTTNLPFCNIIEITYSLKVIFIIG